ncbi:MAG: L,D-transpeptidase family protein [Bacteroidetes bacterium]|nr:L,D-transpeptidase family protein [Bacteroidota bacterium]
MTGKNRSIWVIVLLTAVLLTAACTGKPPAPAKHAVRDTTIVAANAYTHLLLDSLTVQRFVDDDVKDSATAAAIISFYNTRNYQYAWFDEEGLTGQAGAFWTNHQAATATIDNTVTRDSLFHAGMDSLIDGNSMTLTNTERERIELGLTVHFFRYMSPTLAGEINPADLKWYIPARRIDAAEALDSLLNGKNPGWHPLGQRFYQLRTRLLAYSKLQKEGGWPSIRLKEKTLKKGAHSPQIESIRKRLQLAVDSAGAATTAHPATEAHAAATAPVDTTLFDSVLEQNVRRAQRSFGLPATGIIDQALIDELNIPIGQRIEQLLINLQRLKWMPEEDSSYILVNIPDYRLLVYHRDSIVSTMRVVVGKAAHHTVIFSGQLKYVVFSPYWNIPASIVRNEILPAMKKDRRYLDRHRMEITGYSAGLPVIRQKPGPGNALGKVKFLFPNRYNIYLHDTPQRDLFEKDRRAFSHGCIRIQHPFGLASLLLSNNPKWNGKKIREAMNGSAEKWVTLQPAIPIYIVYLTAWVDNEGLLHFAKDIYGHDSEMASHLFAR